MMRKGLPVYRLFFLGLVLSLLAGCQGAAPEPPPDPLDVITTASENVRQLETFRMIVEQTGAPYFIPTELGNALFRRAEAAYVLPDQLAAEVRLSVQGIPALVDIYSRGADQWFRNEILTFGQWVNAPYSPGFNPETLIAEETGFQAALAALIDMEYIDTVTLESGVPAYHLNATAEGENVTALLAELIILTGEVEVDVYVDHEAILPVRFVIVDPDTVTEENPEPTTWLIDIYDFNADIELEVPPALAGDAAAATADINIGPLIQRDGTAEVGPSDFLPVTVAPITPEPVATETVTPETGE